MLRFGLLFLTLCGILGCDKSNKTPSELKSYFYNKKPKLDLLIDHLNKDKSLDSAFRIPPDSSLPNIKKSHPVEHAILNECGIIAASSHPNAYPKGSRWYYFKTKWKSGSPIILSCNKQLTQDSSERKVDFYKKDQSQNEWWGLGNGWQMLHLVKPLGYTKN